MRAIECASATDKRVLLRHKMLCCDNVVHTAGLVRARDNVELAHNARRELACAVEPCHNRVSLQRQSYPVAQCTI